MSTTTVYGSVSSDTIRGYNSTYLTARSTAVDVGTGPGAGLNAGQYYSSPTYYCYEATIGWDTSSIPDGDTISSAVISLLPNNVSGLGTNFTARVRANNWGTTTTTADWVAGASLSGLTLWAEVSTVGATNGVYLAMSSQAALLTAINKTGMTLGVLSSSRHEDGTTPGGWEDLGCSTDCKLVVTHGSVTTTGLAAEYVAKLAKTGTLPGNNTDPTVSWVDLIAANNGTLANSGGNFAWNTSSGWAGAGSAGDPYCLCGDGTGDLVTIAASAAVNPASPFSLEAWFYRASAPAATEYVAGNHASNKGWALYIATTGHCTWRMGTGTTYKYFGSAAGGGVGAWKHFVVTYDGTTYRSYVNGSAGTYGDWTWSQNTGVAVNLFNSGANTAFAGKIATFRSYSACLSPSQVTANYNAGVTAASTDARTMTIGAAAAKPASAVAALETFAAALTGAAGKPASSVATLETFAATVGLSAGAAASAIATLETFAATVGLSAGAAASAIAAFYEAPQMNLTCDIALLGGAAGSALAMVELFTGTSALTAAKPGSGITAAETFANALALSAAAAGSGAQAYNYGAAVALAAASAGSSLTAEERFAAAISLAAGKAGAALTVEEQFFVTMALAAGAAGSSLAMEEQFRIELAAMAAKAGVSIEVAKIRYFRSVFQARGYAIKAAEQSHGTIEHRGIIVAD